MNVLCPLEFLMPFLFHFLLCIPQMKILKGYSNMHSEKLMLILDLQIVVALFSNRWLAPSHFLKAIIEYRDSPGRSEGKEPACNARDPSSIPGSGRSAGEGIGCPLQYFWASLVAQLLKKKKPCNVGDLSLTPRLERIPEKGNIYPFQYSGLENSME